MLTYEMLREIAIDLMGKNKFGERFILISESKKYEEIGNQIRRKLGLKDAKILSKSILNIGRWLNIFFGWLVPQLKMATRNQYRIGQFFQYDF